MITLTSKPELTEGGYFDRQIIVERKGNSFFTTEDHIPNEGGIVISKYTIKEGRIKLDGFACIYNSNEIDKYRRMINNK
jgi:hypothetical protein